MSDEALPTRLDRVTVYESPWVNLYRDRVSMPNGHVVEQYHLLDFERGAVAVIVENDEGHVLMERVSRYPTGTVSWELPAGGIEVGESVLDAAQREVSEETGYATHDHEHLYTYHPMNGISNMTVDVMRCKAGPRLGHVDENEIQGARWFSAKALRQMIKNYEITDGFALTGLLLHINNL